MNSKLRVTNTLSREKEEFIPIDPPFVGLYVCGPTVYGNPHLGHARPYITFDVVNRWLKELGYKVRYVRNITDVGHLVADADEGEDKIAKKAKAEKLEPMEIAQFYTDRFHDAMRALNINPPNIEPRASGHIIEQIEMIQKIIDNGFAYESNGSVYFDIPKYAKSHSYGELSGRVLEDLLSGQGSRELEGQTEKRDQADFALWKKANPEHIMRWPSPWSDGFPGWHIECSAMSKKYLGETFDIHGGGMDLLFPHHECEIAQSKAGHSHAPVKYWIHNNMITINGQKMGKSLGNFIDLEQFFDGSHKLLEKSYGPMTIRFFILQAHYRGTVDFSNEALIAAEKGLKRLMSAAALTGKLRSSDVSTSDVTALVDTFSEAMNDDFNTPILIAGLFEAVRIINSVHAGHEKISKPDLELLIAEFNKYTFDILGLLPEDSGNADVMDGLMQLVISLRADARVRKDFPTSDKIRDELKQINISLKDEKEGTTWSFEN